MKIRWDEIKEKVDVWTHASRKIHVKAGLKYSEPLK